jgi:serine protease Do
MKSVSASGNLWGRVRLVALGLIIGGGAALVGAGLRAPAAHANGLGESPIARVAPPARALSATPSRVAGMPVSYADLASRVAPSVVTVRAERLVRPTSGGFTLPDDPFLRQFFGDQFHSLPQRPFRQGGLGSGVVVSSDGYILTNHHVVDGAERIAVTLADGRSFRGTVVGTDPAIDVALVKITAEGRLPVAPLGDSDQLRVGEWVCAIGNPLGYVHSVTVGVVSFIGRKLFDPSLDDYIQTDAFINFGNSGGPLINARGEVIGINSAISRRASNIGFAIPINQVVEVLPQLRTRGRVSRGYMGVGLMAVSPDLQRSLRLPGTQGALVLEVYPGSPGEHAGLRLYDLIQSVDDHEVLDDNDLIREISLLQPGTTVKLQLLRDDHELTVAVKLAERPLDESVAANLPGGGEQPDAADTQGGGRPTLGLGVRDLDEAFARRFGIPADVQGVVVAHVDSAGPAYATELRRGWVIMQVNRRPVHSAAEFDRLVASSRPGEALALYVYNPIPGQRDLVALTVDEAR